MPSRGPSLCPDPLEKNGGNQIEENRGTLTVVSCTANYTSNQLTTFLLYAWVSSLKNMVEGHCGLDEGSCAYVTNDMFSFEGMNTGLSFLATVSKIELVAKVHR